MRACTGDEERFLDHLEMRLEEQLKTGRFSEEEIARMVHRAEIHRQKIEAHLAESNPELLARVRLRTEKHRKHFEAQNPTAYHHLRQLQGKEPPADQP